MLYKVLSHAERSLNFTYALLCSNCFLLVDWIYPSDWLQALSMSVGLYLL